MTAYIITYDLMKSGQNYECLKKKLESYPTHWHMQQSVWLIKSTNSAEQIRDHLSPCLDSNDKLFVGALSSAAWQGISKENGDWIKRIFIP